MTSEEIGKIFTYHPPSSEQIPKFGVIRGTAKSLAHVILENTPESPEQTLAILKLQEAVMYANAAIAIHSK